eukprot:scaffold12330_cov83-Skeletonema_marinoi.AAC.15
MSRSSNFNSNSAGQVLLLLAIYVYVYVSLCDVTYISEGFSPINMLQLVTRVLSPAIEILSHLLSLD